jgi:AcrR family transcriptional regulator
MAHPTISDEEFLSKALELFRTYGYEGVSLSQLAAATGLEKASLYYRYPGGKQEIMMAVMSLVEQGFEKNVFAPLKGEGMPRKRLGIVMEHLREFYCDGAKPCVMDVLGIAGGSEQLADALRSIMKAWLKAFAEIAREGGLSMSVARNRAEEAILRLEGALVLARVLGDTAPFQRTIKALPALLLEE